MKMVGYVAAALAAISVAPVHASYSTYDSELYIWTRCHEDCRSGNGASVCPAGWKAYTDSNKEIPGGTRYHPGFSGSYPNGQDPQQVAYSTNPDYHGTSLPEGRDGVCASDAECGKCEFDGWFIFGDYHEHCKCQPCAPGYYAHSGMTGCSKCPSGKTSYHENENPKSYGASVCYDCPMGMTAQQDSAMFPQYNTPANHDKWTLCSHCPAGQERSSSNNLVCTACSGGMARSANDRDGCRMCSAGRVPNADKSACDVCPIGTYRSYSDASDSCHACPVGLTTSSTGSSSAEDCSVDIDECSSGTDDCDQFCNNIVRMGPSDNMSPYQCSCLSPFTSADSACSANSATITINEALTTPLSADGINVVHMGVTTEPLGCEDASCDTWDVSSYAPHLHATGPNVETRPGSHEFQIGYSSQITVDDVTLDLAIPQAAWDSNSDITFVFAEGFPVSYAGKEIGSISTSYNAKFIADTSSPYEFSTIDAPVETLNPSASIVPVGCLEADNSGMPFDLTVSQELSEGSAIKLTFTFRDGSMAAELYQWKYSSIDEEGDENGVDLIQKTTIDRASTEYTCGQRINVGASAIDSITSEDFGRPGTVFTFSARTKNAYTMLSGTTSSFFTDLVTTDYTIYFDAYVKGKVVDLADKGVTHAIATWWLVDYPDIKTNVTTDKNGYFDFHVIPATMGLPDFNAFEQTYQIELKVAKHSYITHDIQACSVVNCAGASAETTANSKTIDLHHRDWKLPDVIEAPIFFIDKSSYSVSGNVFFSKKLFDDGISPLAALSGATEKIAKSTHVVHGATVCAKSYVEGLDFDYECGEYDGCECDTVDSDGFYSVSLSLGITYRIFASLGEHTFILDLPAGDLTAMDPSSDAVLCDSDHPNCVATFTVSADTGNVENVDFVGTSSTSLDVWVYGGLCKLQVAEEITVDVVFDEYYDGTSTKKTTTCTINSALPDSQYCTINNVPATTYSIEIATPSSSPTTTMETLWSNTLVPYFTEFTPSVAVGPKNVSNTHEVTFQYDVSPELEMTFPPKGYGTSSECTDFQAVLLESFQYEMEFEVTQDFSAFGSGVCKKLTGDLSVTSFLFGDNEVQTASVAYNATVDASVSMVTLGVGEPNVNPTQKHLKQITVDFMSTSSMVADEDLDHVQVPFNFAVKGYKIKDPNAYQAVPIDRPLTVLHVPPGSGSSVTLSMSSSVTSTESIGNAFTVGVEGSLDVSMGYKQAIPLIGDVKIKQGVKANIADQFYYKYSTSSTTSTSISQSFSASAYYDWQHKAIVGEEADLIVFESKTIKFAETDFVHVPEDTCDAEIMTTVTWSQGSDTALSAMTVHDIKLKIEEKHAHMELYNCTDLTYECSEDQEETYYNYLAYILTMEELIDHNKHNRENAVALSASLPDVSDVPDAGTLGDFSLDMDNTVIDWHGGSFSYSATISESASESQSTSWYNALSGGVSYYAEAEGTLFGVTGKVAGSFGASFSWTHDRSSADGQSSSVSVSFTLSDSDSGDHYLTKIMKDPVYGTPIFKVEGGQSRCWLEEGTTYRQTWDVRFVDEDGNNLGDTYTNLDLESGEKAYPILEVCNNSPTGDTVRMSAGLIGTSNPYSLEVRSSDTSLTGHSLSYYLSPGDCSQSIIEVERQIERVYKYDAVGFFIYPVCDNGVLEFYQAPEMYLEWKVPCPLLRVKADGGMLDDFILSNGLNDGSKTLSFTVINDESFVESWDHNKEEFEMNLRYRKKASSDNGINGEWITVNLCTEHPDNCADLTSEEKLVHWDTSDDLSDGNYEVQIYAYCGGDRNIQSLVWGGSVDFTNPTLLEGFLDPKPSQGFELTENLQIWFSEPVNCDKIELGETITITVEDEEISAADIVCVGRIVSIGFISTELDFSDLMGKELSVSIDFEDYLGNEGVSKTITWEVLEIDEGETAIEIDDLTLYHQDIIDYCVDLESTMCENIREMLIEDIAALVGVSTDRIIQFLIHPPDALAVGSRVSFSFTPAVGEEEPAWSLAYKFQKFMDDEEKTSSYPYLQQVAKEVVSTPAGTMSTRTTFSSVMSTGWIKVDPNAEVPDTGGNDNDDGGSSTTKIIKEEKPSVLGNESVGAGLCAALVLSLMAVFYGKVKYSILKREVARNRKHKKKGGGAEFSGSNPMFQEWIAEMDPHTGDMAMVNLKTREKAMKTKMNMHPTEVSSAMKDKSWKAKEDPKTGKTYYMNSTGEMSWVKPEVVASQVMDDKTRDRKNTALDYAQYRERKNSKSWEKKTCKESGRKYYQDVDTGVRSWSKSGASLPDKEWKQQIDEDTGMSFFQNSISNKKTFLAPIIDEEELDDEWVAQVDQESGAEYYYSTKSRAVTWTDPRGPGAKV